MTGNYISHMYLSGHSISVGFCGCNRLLLLLWVSLLFHLGIVARARCVRGISCVGSYRRMRNYYY